MTHGNVPRDDRKTKERHGDLLSIAPFPLTINKTISPAPNRKTTN
ncbi:hypothetical protein DA2_0960 [Desulfovibrio sp. A2]|nr:hypothetical protein DA2_0960 [Desulfovibrio sp. A2]